MDRRRAGLSSVQTEPDNGLHWHRARSRATWGLYMNTAPELAACALALLDFTASEAAAERSFSRQGLIHTKPATVCLTTPCRCAWRSPSTSAPCSLCLRGCSSPTVLRQAARSCQMAMGRTWRQQQAEGQRYCHCTAQMRNWQRRRGGMRQTSSVCWRNETSLSRRRSWRERARRRRQLQSLRRRRRKQAESQAEGPGRLRGRGK